MKKCALMAIPAVHLPRSSKYMTGYHKGLCNILTSFSVCPGLASLALLTVCLYLKLHGMPPSSIYLPPVDLSFMPPITPPGLAWSVVILRDTVIRITKLPTSTLVSDDSLSCLRVTPFVPHLQRFRAFREIDTRSVERMAFCSVTWFGTALQ